MSSSSAATQREKVGAEQVREKGVGLLVQAFDRKRKLVSYRGERDVCIIKDDTAKPHSLARAVWRAELALSIEDAVVVANHYAVAVEELRREIALFGVFHRWDAVLLRFGNRLLHQLVVGDDIDYRLSRFIHDRTSNQQAYEGLAPACVKFENRIFFRPTYVPSVEYLGLTHVNVVDPRRFWEATENLDWVGYGQCRLPSSALSKVHRTVSFHEASELHERTFSPP